MDVRYARRSRPPVTRALILVNVVVYLAELGRGDSLIATFALWPLGAPGFFADAFAGHFHVWQLVTYAFLHGSGTHLFLNMFALHTFGSEIERVFGPARYLEYYAAAVVTAAVTQLVVLGVVGGPAYPTIGASGGVFGLLLAFGVLFPQRRLVLIFPPIPIRAWLLVTLYGMLELYLGVTGTMEGIAHFAHLGGMLGGWLLLRRWLRAAREQSW